MFRKRFRLSVSLVKALILSGAPLLLFLVLMPAPKAVAIPAFARKYQTSCQTCHSNFPELNDFGEAFKKNGFKFPKDDETFVKEPPVLLGAEAQRENFPKVIYPGEIPGTIPISFRFVGFGCLQQQTAIVGRRCAADRSVHTRHVHDHCRRQLRTEALLLGG